MTKQQVIDAVKEELLSSYGSFSNGDTPYTMLGILYAGLNRINENPSVAITDFKMARLRKDLTLRDVEKKTGISNAYLSQLENGKIKKPSHEVITTLTNFYNSQNNESLQQQSEIPPGEK